MVKEPRCGVCQGILTEGDGVCPWCGHDINQPVKGDFFSFKKTIFLVAILGILCLILIYKAAFYDPYPTFSYRSVMVSHQEITNRTIDDEVRWDMKLTVTMVHDQVYDDYKPWSEVHLKIMNSDGNILDLRLDLKKYDESKLDDNEDGTISVQAWYIDKSDPPKGMNRNDKIVITGMSRAYEGGYMMIIIDGRCWGDFKLPDEFV